MQATQDENEYMLSKNMLYLWLRGDNEINHMVEEQYTEEEILAKVSGDKYWTKQEIVENFEHELRKISILDRFSSFPIYSFIRENYQKMEVFVDGTHFSVYLHIYLANEIAKYLHIELISDPDIIEKVIKTQRSTMPIYPCVKQALGIDIEDRYRFYHIRKNEIEYLSFKEYIKKYIRYIADIQDIADETGTFFR